MKANETKKPVQKNENKGGGGGGAATAKKPEGKAQEQKKPETKTEEKPAPPKEPEAKAAGPAVQEVAKQEVAKKDAQAEDSKQMPGTRKKAGEGHNYSYSGQGEGMRSGVDHRSKVLALFMENPDEIYTFPEIAKLLNISKHHAWCATRDLEDMEDLAEAKSAKSNKKGHKLAPTLAAEAKKARQEDAAATK